MECRKMANRVNIFSLKVLLREVTLRNFMGLEIAKGVCLGVRLMGQE